MSIRDSLASRAVGGPRFRPQPDKLLIEVDGRESLTQLATDVREAGNPLDVSPGDRELMDNTSQKLSELGFNVKRLDNLGVLVAETSDLEQVLNNIIQQENQFDSDVVNQIQRSVENARERTADTDVAGFKLGRLNFGNSRKATLEANLRNQFSKLSLGNPLTDAIEQLGGVLNVELNYSRNTFGPRNLNVDVLSEARSVKRRLTEDGSKPDLGDAIQKFGGETAWQIDTGERAVAAIFDTSFCKDFFQDDRIIDTFHGDDVDSAFTAPEEGHGTMTAYSMAGNSDGNVLSYNGVAKDADLLLARLSDKDGKLVYAPEAWDWLIQHIKELDKPVISNHSYGVPLCSAATMDNCSSTTTKIARIANEREDHQAFYAAGNEALYCGHRLSGVTNGINGINSDPTSISVAAFRYDLTDAQNYSSHGFGTCASANNNPKPDLGCLLPTIVPYGCEEKDMGVGYEGSGAGTSEACPLTAGIATLIASVTGTADREVVENILEGTADPVRTTQINFIRNHDARFGNGQVNAENAIKEAQLFAPDNQPEATFTYSPANPEPGDIVNFNAAASSDPDNDIESYSWNFGDGGSATGTQVSYEYGEAGNYDVTLVVEDERGNTGDVTQTVKVQGPPEASFTVSPSDPETSQEITFDASQSRDPNNDIVNYQWDFGDGVTDSGQVVTHSYDDAAAYEVVLTVADSVDNADSEGEVLLVGVDEGDGDGGFGPFTEGAGFGFGILRGLGRQ